MVQYLPTALHISGRRQLKISSDSRGVTQPHISDCISIGSSCSLLWTVLYIVLLAPAHQAKVVSLPSSLFPLHSSLSSLNFTPLTLLSLFAGRYFHNQHIGTHSDLLNKNSFPLTNSLILIPSPSLSTCPHFFPLFSSLLFRLNSSSTLFFFFFFHYTPSRHQLTHSRLPLPLSLFNKVIKQFLNH